MLAAGYALLEMFLSYIQISILDSILRFSKLGGIGNDDGRFNAKYSKYNSPKTLPHHISKRMLNVSRTSCLNVVLHLYYAAATNRLRAMLVENEQPLQTRMGFQTYVRSTTEAILKRVQHSVCVYEQMQFLITKCIDAAMLHILTIEHIVNMKCQVNARDRFQKQRISVMLSMKSLSIKAAIHFDYFVDLQRKSRCKLYLYEVQKQIVKI